MPRRHWLAAYSRRIPVEINVGAYRSVLAMLEGAMERYAGKPAFHCFGQTLSYADINRLSRSFAAYLQGKLGVKKGDRIAVMLPNIPAFPLATLGIIRAGAVLVTVNPLCTPVELKHQLNDAGVRIIIIFNGVSATLGDVLGETAVEQVISVDLGDGTGCAIQSSTLDARLMNAIALSDGLAEGADLAFKPVPLSGNDLVFLQYTSAAPGLSKGAALSHRNLVANTEQFKAFISGALCPGHEVIVTALPLYDIFALVVNFISYYSSGAENYLVPDLRSMDSLIGVLKQARSTVFVGDHGLFEGLLMHPEINDVDVSSLRLAISADAAWLPATSAKWKTLTGKDVIEGYGLPESPILTLNPIIRAGFCGTAGLPLPSTDIKLVDGEEREVAIGEAGEICANGPQVIEGYWRNPEANAGAFTADGYFRTGDIGVFDAEGYLKIVGRKKDIPGFNVYPIEAGRPAADSAGITECA